MRRNLLQILTPYLLLAVIGGLVGVGLWSYLDASSAGEGLEWRKPWALVLLGGCILCAWVSFHLRARRAATFSFSRVHDLAPAQRGLIARLGSLPAVLRIIALGLIAVALARPQTFKTEIRKVEGIDIMIVLDLSKSMEERDLLPDRLGAGQCVIHDFISQLEEDRVGLVVFAREAMLQCPLTLDYRSLDQVVAALAIGDVPEMGTAIGDALGLSLASLRRSDARSKIVILISDGDSNVATHLDPREAKDLAVDMGVKVFTVLMGRETGGGPFLGRGQYAVNPELLQEIARDTGGAYFNAPDPAALSASFEEIRRTLETTERKVIGRTADKDLFPQVVIAAVALLFLEITLVLTRWRRFP